MTDEHDDPVAAAFAGLRDEVEDSVGVDASLTALHATSSRRAVPRALTALGAVAAVAVLVVAGAFVVRSGDAPSSSETADGGATPPSIAQSTTVPPDAVVDCDEPSIHLYLEPGVTAEQVAEVERRLEEIDPGSPWTYVDSAATYAEFERLFAESPDFLAAIDPADLPPTFRRIVEGELSSLPIERLNDIPGVLRAEGTPPAHPGCADAPPSEATGTTMPPTTVTAPPTNQPSMSQPPSTQPPVNRGE
jgi:hypothetical protein